MRNSSDTIIAALAIFRLVRLIIAEEGPFSLMLKLRGRLDPDQRTWLGRGLNCPWCLSFWLGPLLVAVQRTRIGRVLTEGLAVSALVGLGTQHGAWFVQVWGKRR